MPWQSLSHFRGVDLMMINHYNFSLQSDKLSMITRADTFGSWGLQPLNTIPNNHRISKMISLLNQSFQSMQRLLAGFLPPTRLCLLKCIIPIRKLCIDHPLLSTSIYYEPQANTAFSLMTYQHVLVILEAEVDQLCFFFSWNMGQVTLQNKLFSLSKKIFYLISKTKALMISGGDQCFCFSQFIRLVTRNNVYLYHTTKNVFYQIFRSNFPNQF